MAWIPIYLNQNDVKILNDFLNEEEEIAYLVSNGTNKWIAKAKIDILTESGKDDFSKRNSGHKIFEYSLWHIPSGKLPLIGLEDNKFIEDPWKGWSEYPKNQRQTPYFGAGYPGIISITLKVDDEEVPMSSFEWIGNHYKIIGIGADKSTEKFWKKLRRFIKKNSNQIPRCNYSEGKNEVFALENAYKEILNGKDCALNP